MTGGEIARRYAKALVELAEKGGTLQETGEEIEQVARTLREHAELRRVLENPRFPRAERTRLVDGILEASGTSALLHRFVRVVAEKDRLSLLPGIAFWFRELADERQGRVRAKVVSAAGLHEAATEGLKKKLSEVTGREVILEAETDESLIGGVVCRVGGMVMDGSIRNQLKNLRDQLVEK